jgi:biopolymer transport protein ExbB/TolQ
MSDFEVRIKTTADLKGAAEAKGALEQQIASTKKLGGDSTGLEGALRKVNGALSEAGVISGNTAGAVEKMAGAIGGKAIGALAGMAAALGVAKKGIEEFAQAEQQVAKLDAALAQSGQLTDDYREQLQDLAGELQKTTGVADDEWIGVLTRLVQFGSDPKTIGMDVEAVKNLAGLLGGDVTQAANLVARALQGNFQMFSRLGIQIDENASQAEKLGKVYQELALRGGGQLAAVNQTLSGQFKSLGNNISDFFEAIGRGIAKTGILQTVIYGFSESARFLASVLGGVVPKVAELENAAKRTKQTLDGGADSANTYAGRLDEIKAAAERAAEASNTLKERIQDTARAQAEMEDLKLAENLGAIDTLEKLRVIAPEEATRRRGTARRASAERKVVIEEKQDEDLIQVEVDKMRQDEARAQSLKAEVEATRALLQKVEAAEAAKSKLSGLQESFDRAMAKADLELKAADPAGLLSMKDAQRLRPNIDRAQEEVLRTRAALPAGTPSADELRGRLKGIEPAAKAAATLSDVTYSKARPVIESIERRQDLRRETFPRRQALDQRTIGTEALPQVDKGAGKTAQAIQGIGRNLARAEAEKRQLMIDALNTLRAEQNLTKQVLQEWIKRASSRAADLRTR